MPPANIGYCRRNRSRSRGKRVRVHGTGGSEPRPLSGRLVSSAIIFIAIDKANIVNLLTTGRSYVKTPKGRRETSAPRPPRVSASTEARVGETAEERERKKEREKENARKGEAKRGREMERKGARARARRRARERIFPSRHGRTRIYAGHVAFPCESSSSKTPCGSLDAEVHPDPESVSSKDARKEASGRLAPHLRTVHGSCLRSLRLSSCLRGRPARVPEQKIYLRTRAERHAARHSQKFALATTIE